MKVPGLFSDELSSTPYRLKAAVPMRDELSSWFQKSCMSIKASSAVEMKAIMGPSFVACLPDGHNLQSQFRSCEYLGN